MAAIGETERNECKKRARPISRELCNCDGTTMVLPRIIAADGATFLGQIAAMPAGYGVCCSHFAFG